MNRRTFIKRGSLLVPMIFIPRLIRAAPPAHLNPSFFRRPPVTGGGGGACTPSYANAGGTGDRTASITVSQFGLVSSGTLSQLVNGLIDNVIIFNGSPNTSAKFLRFFFGTASQKVINEIKFYQNAAVAHGVWQVQGSNDASTWTNIGSTFTLGGASGANIISAISANTTGFDYYQFDGVSGASSGSAFIQELEFKICA